MEGQKTTWKTFLELLQEMAIDNDTGYIIYKHLGFIDFLSYEELKKRLGRYPGKYLGRVEEPITLEAENEGKPFAPFHISSSLEAIASDMPVHIHHFDLEEGGNRTHD